MDDIRGQDRRLFTRELLRPGRIFLSAVAISFVTLIFSSGNMSFPVLLALIAAPLVTHGLSSYNVSLKKRFLNKRFEALWNGCQDRLERFEEVLKKMRRDQVADLQEMPRTIRRVADSLYAALRRADMISHEVSLTERGVYAQPPTWSGGSNDPQAKELYRLADKNIAEYRQQFAGVMAGVQRAEAQSAVFMTTLDTFRMKMIGYRLVGKNPELNSQDFLEALSEAKLQLHAIDQALDELDFSQFPKMISVMPPPVPSDVQERLRQGN
jgi:hypothetical protein